MSGARNAALAQIDQLMLYAKVDLFTIVNCNDTELKQRYRVISMPTNNVLQSLSKPFQQVIKEQGRKRRIYEDEKVR